MTTQPRQRTYDHRLVRLVQETGDVTTATGIGVPRSTSAGWLRRAPQTITKAHGMDASEVVRWLWASGLHRGAYLALTS